MARKGETWNESETYRDAITLREVRRVTTQGMYNQTPTYHTNIGPAPDGSVPPEATERLQAVGKWVAQNGEAMYGQVDRAERGRMDWMPTGQWTIKDNTAYYWCTRWSGETLVIGGLQSKVEKVSILATGQETAFEQSEQRLIIIGLPAENPDATAGVTVLKIECAEPPRQVLGAGCVVLD